MIKNYIFDFGNVLVRFDPRAMTAAYIPDADTCRLVSDIVFDRAYWDHLDDGSFSNDMAKNAFLPRLPSHLREIACRVFDNWVGLLTPIDGMREVVTEIKQNGGRLYLLSNISKGFAETYTQYPVLCELLEPFDGLVLSGSIGMTKPHHEIYEYILERYELKAKECLFIDDSEINVNGAAAVGINSYVFDGNVEALRKAVGLS